MMRLSEAVSSDTIELLNEAAQCEAREKFWAYRRYINPQMLIDWWPREVAQALHRFWLEYKAGLRPKLLLQSPPQHGKSVSVVDFLSWIAGQDRDVKIIFASFSDRLGTRANLRMQRLCSHEKYVGTFGGPILQGGGMLQNTRILEFRGGDGYFRNTTVQGSVTGEGLDIGVIDDPIKGRAEASSQLNRDKTWSWMTDDFLPRFADRAGLLMIMTRWHLDDPAGRLIERYPGLRVLRYPALAEQDEIHEAVDARGRPIGPFVRREGDALFPKLKSLAFLHQQRSVMTQGSWSSIYQQAPITVGGGLYPVEKLTTLQSISPENVKRSVRYWDKAGTHEGGDYTAGVLMHAMRNGSFVIAHVVRGRWSALDREAKIKFWTKADAEAIGSKYEVVIEQEPGSGGKESAESTIRNLAGFRVFADRVTGSKETRAEPFAAQVQGGNVYLLPGQWHYALLDEMETFPNGKHRDQCDACSGAFNRLAGGPTYSVDSGWLDD